MGDRYIKISKATQEGPAKSNFSFLLSLTKNLTHLGCRASPGKEGAALTQMQAALSRSYMAQPSHIWFPWCLWFPWWRRSLGLWWWQAPAGDSQLRPWAVQQGHAICSRKVYISQQSKTNFHGASSDYVARTAHRELAFVRPKLKDPAGQHQSTVRWRWYSQDWAWAGQESIGKLHGPHHPCPSMTPLSSYRQL